MMRNIKYLVVLLLVNQSCVYQNAEDLYPNTSCDTLNMSFVRDVYPVIQVQCNSCHDAANQFGGVNLEGYENVKQYAFGSMTTTINQPTGGRLAMPPSGKMPDCTVKKITAWVNQGAKDN